jgi:hypothetical protein
MNHTALFISTALAPFGLALMMLIARPISRALQKRMRDSWLKRLLFISW